MNISDEYIYSSIYSSAHTHTHISIYSSADIYISEIEKSPLWTMAKGSNGHREELNLSGEL